jgi:hypothetical protein
MPVLSTSTVLSVNSAEGPPFRGLHREFSRTAWEPALLKNHNLLKLGELG